jgi:hypothetical protein
MFRFFKKSRVSGLSKNFDEQVHKCIHILGRADNSPEDKELIELLTANQIPLTDALEITCFLPIAFVRQYLPSVKWPDFYFEVSKKNKFIKKKFSQTLPFQRISTVVDAYFESSPAKDEILKIAGRSAEFRVINELLLQYPEYTAQDVKLTPLVITLCPTAQRINSHDA